MYRYVLDESSNLNKNFESRSIQGIIFHKTLKEYKSEIELDISKYRNLIRLLNKAENPEKDSLVKAQIVNDRNLEIDLIRKGKKSEIVNYLITNNVETDLDKEELSKLRISILRAMLDTFKG